MKRLIMLFASISVLILLISCSSTPTGSQQNEQRLDEETLSSAGTNEGALSANMEETKTIKLFQDYIINNNYTMIFDVRMIPQEYTMTGGNTNGTIAIIISQNGDEWYYWEGERLPFGTMHCSILFDTPDYQYSYLGYLDSFNGDLDTFDIRNDLNFLNGSIDSEEQTVTRVSKDMKDWLVAPSEGNNFFNYFPLPTLFSDLVNKMEFIGTGEVEVDGQSYYYEEFSLNGIIVKFCFNGEELAYILADNVLITDGYPECGEYIYMYRITLIQTQANEALFKIPDGFRILDRFEGYVE